MDKKDWFCEWCGGPNGSSAGVAKTRGMVLEQLKLAKHYLLSMTGRMSCDDRDQDTARRHLDVVISVLESVRG